MNDKPGKTAKNTSRRKLLTGTAVLGAAIGAGGVLPKEWTRPVVESVLLPAHANISGCSGTFCDIGVKALITVSGGTVMASVGADSGSGPFSPDGTFSFALSGGMWIQGTIASDCSQIQGGGCEGASPCGNYGFTYLATPEGCRAQL
ncbi:MAG: twin-arginine translocation signal domain-containing protein [Arenicellales bacterium]